MFDDREFRVDSTMTDNGVLTIQVVGELDADTAPRLLAEIDRWLGIKVLIVDLGGCTFVDSAGITSLVTCRRAVTFDAVMRLIGADATVERTLRLAGLEELLGLDASTNRRP